MFDPDYVQPPAWRQWQAWWLCRLIERHELGPGTTPDEVCHSVVELHEEVALIGKHVMRLKRKSWRRAKRKGKA